MTEDTFSYWTSDGHRHDVPIEPLLVPDGVTLGPGHSVLSYDNEDRLPEQSERGASAHPAVVALL